jgi:hypothetical protein
VLVTGKPFKLNTKIPGANPTKKFLSKFIHSFRKLGCFIIVNIINGYKNSLNF